MDIIYLQLDTAQQYVPWYEISSLKEISQSRRKQLALQASFLATYLADASSASIPSDPRDEFRNGIRDGVLQCAKSLCADNAMLTREYADKIQITKSIVCKDVPADVKAKQWEKVYVEAIWLTSRILGKGYALLMGCAVAKRAQLKTSEYVHLMSYLKSEKRLLECVSICERNVFVSRSPTVPAKRAFVNDESMRSVSSSTVGDRADLFISVGDPPLSTSTVVQTVKTEFWPRISKSAKGLFGFLCSLADEEIPEILLLRIMAQTAIWDADGVLRSENTPHVDCIVGDLVSGKAFDFVLLFISIGLIQEQSGDFGRKTFIISSEMRLAFGRDRLFLMEEWPRLVLVCHAFPGHWEEQWFLENGRILLPQLRHAFDHCPSIKSRVIDDPTHGYKVLLTLILSTRVPGADWRLKAINIAEDILSARPGFGNSNLIYLESLLRLRKLEVSRRLQSAHFDNIDYLHSPIDARSNCIHGAVVRSKAQDYIMENPSNLEEADRLLRTFGSWNPTSPSSMELYEINLQRLILCKIRRWKAEFGQAVEQLDALTHFFGHNYDDTGCNFWSHYAGTLCELHRFTEAEEWSRHAIAAHQDLQSDRIFATGQKRYRMLRLSLAETLLSKALVEHGFAPWENESDLVPSELEESLIIYEELDNEYQTLAKRDWASRLEHLRVVLGKAMIIHLRGLLEDAKQHWNNVLTIVQYCQENNQVTGFLEMIVQYCRCDIAARQDDYNEAHLFLKAAKAQFADIGREHWWTCIGTDFLDHLRDSLAKRDMISGIDGR